MKPISADDSVLIWAIKAVAIFTVFFAHMPWSVSDSYLSWLYSSIGSIGVPIFLFLSGYLDYGSKTRFVDKIINLVVPLMIWGTLTYAFQLLMGHHEISISTIGLWLKWVLGSGTWYYFVPVLLMCTLMGRYINNFALILISIVSIALSNVIPNNEVFTKYLNPFFFVVYFSAGRLVREKEWLISNNKWWGGVLSAGFILVTALLKLNVSYFSLFCIPFSFSCFILMVFILRLIIRVKRKMLINVIVPIGKISFVIYLTHMPIASTINRHIFGVAEHFKVILAFGISCILVLCLKFILHSCHKDKFLKKLGFR